MTEATVLLQRIDQGDRDASARLFSLVYDELHSIARAQMNRQRGDHTLQATALVHESWLRLARNENTQAFNGREHFLRAAAKAMRQILVDHARTKNRDKRGGGALQLSLEDLDPAEAQREEGLVEIDEALQALEATDPDLAEIVELRFFGGYPMEEVARLCDISLSTTERRWRLARAWLRRALAHPQREGSEDATQG